MLRDYTAKELSVQPGAEVTVGEAMNGWVWSPPRMGVRAGSRRRASPQDDGR